MSLRAKIRGNRNFFLVLPVSMRLLCALFSFSVNFLCCVFRLCFSPVSPYCFALCVMFLHCLLLWMLCFFADLPILLPSVGFSPLLCVIIRLGVFRVSEAKNLGFVL